jgi:hypothetical protein
VAAIAQAKADSRQRFVKLSLTEDAIEVLSFLSECVEKIC